MYSSDEKRESKYTFLHHSAMVFLICARHAETTLDEYYGKFIGFVAECRLICSCESVQERFARRKLTMLVLGQRVIVFREC
jgi:hypothetical protein